MVSIVTSGRCASARRLRAAGAGNEAADVAPVVAAVTRALLGPLRLDVQPAPAERAERPLIRMRPLRCHKGAEERLRSRVPGPIA